MEIIYLKKAKEDRGFWIQSGNKAIQNKITQLIASIIQTPFSGIGKPEQLKYDLSGKWSRRISEEHRLVYAVVDNRIVIYSMQGHY